LALALVGGATAHWTATGAGSGSGSVATARRSGTRRQPGRRNGDPHMDRGDAARVWLCLVLRAAKRREPRRQLPDPGRATSVLTCADTGLANGTYTYTATAVWHSWTATSSPTTVAIVGGPTVTFSSGRHLATTTGCRPLWRVWLQHRPVTISCPTRGVATSTAPPHLPTGPGTSPGTAGELRRRYGVYQTTDQTVIVTATDGTRTATVRHTALQPEAKPGRGSPRPFGSFPWGQLRSGQRGT